MRIISRHNRREGAMNFAPVSRYVTLYQENYRLMMYFMHLCQKEFNLRHYGN